jgi:hypothetical protein
VKTSPTQRSLKLLRDLGWHVGIVERWNPHAFVRQDLFGWIDIIAVHPAFGILGVQTTSQANAAARMAKARNNPALVAWVAAGGKLAVHGWRKLKNRWQVDVRGVGITELVGDLKGVPEDWQYLAKAKGKETA